jgi:hypothetical protein
VTVLALALVAFALAVAPTAAAQKVSLVFSAGPTGGSWTPMAGATAEVIKKKFPELDVQVAWSMTNVLSDALTGQGRHVIKAGTYKDQGIAAAVQTFQSPTILIASSKTPADVIHPGAARHDKEIGVRK